MQDITRLDNGSSSDEIKWWQDATIYQIYPATFKATTNGAPVGDLRGVVEKIPYLASLGIGILWISPFFQSPQADLGYDISDYTKVHEPYGSVADVDEIIKEANKYGIKVLADLVVNHSSNEHAWFKESRSSRDNPKRDWYIWRDARYIDGKREPPSNWRTAFGGPTWTWDEKTEQYYFHTFLSEQPELNWTVKECREAIYNDAVRFWLKRGIAGFRMDTVNMYSKDMAFPDAKITDPLVKEQPAWDSITNGPRIHEYLKEMRQEALGDAFTIGELPNTPKVEDVLSYIARPSRQLDTVIQFDITMLRNSAWKFMITDFKLKRLRELTANGQALADPKNKAFAVIHLENHDSSRIVSRFGNDSPEFRKPSAKMLATYLLTLSGCVIIYQGQEIGMINIPKDVDVDEEYLDCDTIGFLKEVRAAIAAGEAEPSLLEEAMNGIKLSARDHARTPMNWDSSKNGGFSTADKCWMLPHSYKEINVADQENDPDSVLNYFRRIIKFRHEHKDLFVHGAFSYEKSHEDDDNVFIFTKTSKEGKKAVVVLNWRKEPQTYTLPEGSENLKLVFDNGNPGEEGHLNPYAAKIYM
ncbi:alpha-glucosidase [Sporobolomyces salmoneus]|uniref:alpha-glucosidase n=1 Tax=Sporobolomyces salmoneus TaxID=183962 RepID=UPI00317F7482